MVFIHSSDIHLDSSLTSKLSLEKRVDRKSEMLKAFSNMIAYAKKVNARAIIIAGDFFDEKVITAKTVNIVLDLIKDASNIDFLYLTGNHDGGISLLNSEDIPINLKLFSTDITSFVYDDVVISGVVATKDNYDNFYDDINLDDTKTNIFVLHGQVDKSLKKGDIESIDIKRLKDKSIDYLALGHIHSYQKHKLDDKGVYVYCGCLEPRGFDEVGDKGFVQIDVNNNKLSHSFIKNNLRQVYIEQVDISDIVNTLDMVKHIQQQVKHISCHSMLRVVLTGDIDIDTVIDQSYITQVLSDSYYHFELKDETHIKVDIDSLKQDISLKAEFVKLVSHNTTDLTEDVIKTGVALLSGYEVQLWDYYNVK